jgi:ATP-binding cassette subfamily B protein
LIEAGETTTSGGHGRRIVRLFRPHRARLSAVLGLIVVSAGLGMVSPFLLREVLDVAIPEKDRALLGWLVGGMIFISIATGVLGVGQTWLSNLVGQRVMHDLRTQVYRHLQRLSLAFFTKTRTGEIQSRIANDIGGVQTVVTTTATSIVANVTTVVASVVAMFLLDWRLALFSLGLTPFFVALARRVGNQRKAITTVKQGAMADISSLVQESLSVSGILLGKTMGRGGELADRFEGESARLADLEVRSRMAGRWMMASIQTSFAVMPALVYLFAGLSPSAVSIGTVVAFTTLQTRLFWPLQGLLNVGVDIQTSTALFDRVFEYLDLPVDIHPGTRELHDVRGEVSFDDVWFSYDSEPTLRGIDLVVPAGTRTALVGETGSGKTTLGYLAARLYDPERGSVRLDGVRLQDLTLSSLADAVGVVSQETYLFHASVRENLRFARPDATDAEIEGAAEAAQIHHTIAALPDGYDTVVGERGFRFSGGEKQRIAIARTILRNPPVLVLDEATSALDVQTERAVGEALERLADSRPCATRTRSSCSRRARSSSAAPTRSCSRSAGTTPRWSRGTKALPCSRERLRETTLLRRPSAADDWIVAPMRRIPLTLRALVLVPLLAVLVDMGRATLACGPRAETCLEAAGRGYLGSAGVVLIVAYALGLAVWVGRLARGAGGSAHGGVSTLKLWLIGSAGVAAACGGQALLASATGDPAALGGGWPELLVACLAAGAVIAFALRAAPAAAALVSELRPTAPRLHLALAPAQTFPALAALPPSSPRTPATAGRAPPAS